MNGAHRMLFQSLLIRVLDRVTRPPVLTVFAILLVSILVLLGVSHLATRTDPSQTDGDPGTGDFGAFFTGGALVGEGQGTELYNFATQRAIQDEYLGYGRTYWQPYLYPPALAMALAPITGFGYVASFRIFTMSVLFLLLGALLYLRRATPGIAESRFGTATALLLTVGYLPVAATIFGGQNTALTLALLISIYAALRLNHAILAGILLGILTYKPQYALVVGVVLLLGRQFETVAVAALVGGFHYGLGALICGVGWPMDFLAALAEHGPREMAENGPSHFSLPAVALRLLPGMGSKVATVVGSLAILGLMAGAGRRVSQNSARYPAFFGMVVAGTMLLSPHLQYYEAGLLALPAILGVETILSGGRKPSLGFRLLLAAGFLSYPSWQISELLGFQPLFLMLLTLFFWSRYLVVVSPSPG